MGTAYGRAPSSWLLTPAELASPEGQAFAFDLDQMVFLAGTLFAAEHAEFHRRDQALKTGEL